METQHDVKIDIIGGFLGAGKTTFINKLFADGIASEKVALIENEFGDEAIDTEVIEAPDFNMRTLASGCICCTLKADFVTSIRDIVEQIHPDRILIEPTGLAGPDELEATCSMDILASQLDPPVRINSMITIVDAQDAAEMIEYEIPVYLAQLEQARFVVLSHTQDLNNLQLTQVREAIEKHIRDGVQIIDAAWSTIDALEILTLAEHAYAELAKYANGTTNKHTHNHAAQDGHTHSQEHHHGHTGFSSSLLYPQQTFDANELKKLTKQLEAKKVLRAKGFLKSNENAMLHYEFVNGHVHIEPSSYTGQAKLVIIKHDCHNADTQAEA